MKEFISYNWKAPATVRSYALERKGESEKHCIVEEWQKPESPEKIFRAAERRTHSTFTSHEANAKIYVLR